MNRQEPQSETHAAGRIAWCSASQGQALRAALGAVLDLNRRAMHARATRPGRKNAFRPNKRMLVDALDATSAITEPGERCVCLRRPRVRPMAGQRRTRGRLRGNGSGYGRPTAWTREGTRHWRLRDVLLDVFGTVLAGAFADRMATSLATNEHESKTSVGTR
jgi:hypothetical protein